MSKRVRQRLWFWFVIGWGIVLPLLTGLWVWIELRMAGLPVLDINPIGKDWHQILSLAKYLAFVSAVFSAPFIVYAFVLRHKLRRLTADAHVQNSVLLSTIIGGFIALTIVMVLIMYVLWQSSEILGFIIFIPFYVLVPAAIAAIVGMKVGELIGRSIWNPRLR